jgi:ribosomal protein S18 acetylase RimI-like enzyme
MTRLHWPGRWAGNESGNERQMIKGMQPLVDLRAAQPDDAPALVEVKRRTWPDEEVHLEQVQRVLADPAHAVFAAQAEGMLAGFVDGFLTVSAGGVQRWEVDLLAVAPEWRGRQLGQRLVLACLAAGQKKRAQFARALIQLENTASQISFRRCGFQCQSAALCLLVAPNAACDSPAGAGSGHLLKVNTINYRGLWLEEDASPASLAAARAACFQAGLDLVGVLVPRPDLEDNHLNQGFSLAGVYQWWQMEYSVNREGKN